MTDLLCRKNIITERSLTVLVFSFFFSWLLAFPFEGRILYALANHYNISAQSYIFGTMAAHIAGLLLSGVFVHTIQTAKRLMLFTILFCILVSCIFFFPPSYLWTIALLAASFLVGGCVAAWGFYFKNATHKHERIKTIADALIFSNVLMILINVSAALSSPRVGLGISMVMLVIAFLFALRLPQQEAKENLISSEYKEGPVDKNRSLAFLCLFIVIVTINSGLMFQVQGPAYAHHEVLTSWYWAIPYIIALLVMRNLPRNTNRTYILYVAIAMIGFSFIFFMVLDRSVGSYLIVNTLMLGACGVYDLFWWSILGEMLELDKNPARIMGIGLSANVLGVLLGGLIGNTITSVNGYSENPTLLALGVVCITLVMLPPLHQRLANLLKDHIYLTALTEMPNQEQICLIRNQTVLRRLTERENEIALLLLKGMTYRMIALELHVSENTVKTHIKSIYSKAGVQNRTELVNLLLDIKPPLA